MQCPAPITSLSHRAIQTIAHVIWLIFGVFLRLLSFPVPSSAVATAAAGNLQPWRNTTMPAVSQQQQNVATNNAEQPSSLLATMELAADEQLERALNGTPYNALDTYAYRNAEHFTNEDAIAIAWACEVGYREGMFLREHRR
jgi:hypothetical protein